MLNSCDFQGRLAADPELRTTQTGKQVASFRMAVDRDMVDANGHRPTDWLTFTAWGKTAEFVSRYCSQDSSMCWYFENSELKTKVKGTFSIDKVLRTKIENILLKMISFWQQYFFRDLMENGKLRNFGVPVPDVPDSNSQRDSQQDTKQETPQDDTDDEPTEDSAEDDTEE